jgi:hypothetical protein
MLPAPPPFDTVARKWLDLAQRRVDYYVTLYRSGRWKHYYTEEAMALRMLDAIKAARTWAELTPARPDDKNNIRRAA